VERSVHLAADLRSSDVSRTIRTRRVKWPLHSQYVCFLAIRGSSIAGWICPAVLIAREVMDELRGLVKNLGRVHGSFEAYAAKHVIGDDDGNPRYYVPVEAA
jgi:hypothetical protein